MWSSDMKTDVEQLDELLEEVMHKGKRHPKSIACDKIRELFVKIKQERNNG
jgi:hypothetical protein